MADRFHQLPGSNARLHYEVHGDKGPWLIFVSGLGGHGAFWAEQAKYFGKTHRVVFFDHRGHGQSTGGDAASGIEQCVVDLHLLITSLGANTVNLIGHSMGGMIVQKYALEHPNVVETLTISGSTARLDLRHRLLLEFRKKVLLRLGPQDFCRLQTIISLGHVSSKTAGEEVMVKEALALSKLPPSELVTARIDSILRFDTTNELAGLRVPTLVISSSDDHTVPPSDGEELHSLIANSQLKLVPIGGHFFPLTNHALYNELLEEFLCEQPKQ